MTTQDRQEELRCLQYDFGTSHFGNFLKKIISLSYFMVQFKPFANFGFFKNAF